MRHSHAARQSLFFINAPTAGPLSTLARQFIKARNRISDESDLVGDESDRTICSGWLFEG